MYGQSLKEGNTPKVKNHSVWALAGVVSWIACRPANQMSPAPIPGQGTCLGHAPGPQLGVCEKQLINISLPLFLLLFFLSLKVNK